MNYPLYEQNENQASERLSRAMSYLDDDLIMEAGADKAAPLRRRPRVYASFLSAACLVLIIGIGLLAFGGAWFSSRDEYDHENFAQPENAGLSCEQAATEPSDSHLDGSTEKVYSLGDQVSLPVFAESSKAPDYVGNESHTESGGLETYESDVLPQYPVGDSANTVTFLEHDRKAHTVTVRLCITQDIPPLAVIFTWCDGTSVSNFAQAGDSLILININGKDTPDGQLPTAPGTYTVVIGYEWAVQQETDDFAYFSVGPVHFGLTSDSESLH